MLDVCEYQILGGWKGSCLAWMNKKFISLKTFIGLTRYVN